MNYIVVDTDNLGMDGLEVMRNSIIVLQMRLNKSQDLIKIRSRIDLDPSINIRLAHKLAKSITDTSSKVHKPKIYDEAINELMYRNR